MQFLLTRCIAIVCIVSICLVYDYSIVATCPSRPAARFAFGLCFICFALLYVVDLPGEQKQNQRQGLVDRKLVQAPSNFIADRPKATLLFRFFGDFRCGVLVFMIILVLYKQVKILVKC